MNNKNKLRKIIKEEIGKEQFQEAVPVSDPGKKVFDYLVKNITSCLKDEGVETNKLSAQDIQIIAIEWLKQTITSGYVSESLPNDIGENKKITSILKKRKALDVDSYAPGGNDDYWDEQ